MTLLLVGLAPDDTPIVGRERERDLLLEQLDAALSGRGGLALIGGEAGVGKTTLAAAICRAALDRGARALAGRCYDLAETPPYGPWREALAALPADPGRPPLPAALAAGGDAVVGWDALVAGVRAVLAAVGAERPLVLLLDDLHWADQASLDLLRALARGLDELPLLVLATYRADELTSRHPLYRLLPLLAREARPVTLELRRLAANDLRALVRRRYDLPDADEERLAAYLVERAGGNPFFAGELLRALEEERTLERAGAGWRLGDLARAGVPRLLRQVIDARLARLGEAANAPLEVAAVIGQAVPLELWAAVAGADEATLLAVAERAIEARILDATPEGVRFAHALVREALYEGMLTLRRRLLHRCAAEALAATPRSDPDAVAYHFRQADDPRAAEWLDRAAERARRAYSWLSAAERLEAALVILESRRAEPVERGWLLLRLGLVRRHADSAQAAAALAAACALADEAGDPLLGAHARFNSGLVRCFRGGYRAGVAEMATAVAALDGAPPPDAATCARLRGLGVPDLAHYRGTLALWYVTTGRLKDGLALSERAVERQVAAPDLDWSDAAFAAPALTALGLAHAHLGRPDEAKDTLARNLDAYSAAGNVSHATWAALYLLYRALLPYYADDLVELRRIATAAEQLRLRTFGSARGVPWPILAAPLLLLDGRWSEVRALGPAIAARERNARLRHMEVWAFLPLARHDGDGAWARALLRDDLPAGPATEIGTLYYDTYATWLPLAAGLATDTGDLAGGRAWLECHDRLLAASGGVLGRAENALGWAAYWRAAGSPDDARRRAESALAHATEPRQPLALLAARRALGELLTDAGEYAAARAHLDAALALSDACAAPFERALSLLALVELLAATGEADAARAALDEGAALLAPLEARLAIARAARLAARLAAPAPSPIAPAPADLPFGLTARESEILRLVAGGLSNSAVADHLSLSRRTVEQHLRSVYDKLGVENRASATRLAVESGLA